jgi:hypothetical protein
MINFLGEEFEVGEKMGDWRREKNARQPDGRRDGRKPAIGGDKEMDLSIGFTYRACENISHPNRAGDCQPLIVTNELVYTPVFCSSAVSCGVRDQEIKPGHVMESKHSPPP